MTSSSKVLAYIHETAVIAPTARIARNVEIGPYAVISDHVQIGEGTKIGPHVVIKEWTQIGRDCHIFQGASIGEVPQDLKFKGEKSYTFIGDRTTIRECATVHRATGEGEETRIATTACSWHIHTLRITVCSATGIIMSNAAMLAGHATVEDGVVIGGMAGVHQFVKIGRNAMIGGTSKLVQDVVPFTMVDGHPARAVGLNSVGISRAGIPSTCDGALSMHIRSSTARG